MTKWTWVGALPFLIFFGYKFVTRTEPGQELRSSLTEWFDRDKPIKGKARSEFVETVSTACRASDQRGVPKLETIEYCYCYANGLADRLTFGQLRANRGKSDEELTRIYATQMDDVSNACVEQGRPARSKKPSPTLNAAQENRAQLAIEAKRKFDEERFEEAFALNLQAANLGNIAAQYNLALA